MNLKHEDVLYPGWQFLCEYVAPAIYRRTRMPPEHAYTLPVLKIQDTSKICRILTHSTLHINKYVIPEVSFVTLINKTFWLIVIGLNVYVVDFKIPFASATSEGLLNIRFE